MKSEKLVVLGYIVLSVLFRLFSVFPHTVQLTIPQLSVHFIRLLVPILFPSVHFFVSLFLKQTQKNSAGKNPAEKGNAAAIYSPGPSPAKYHRRARA